MPTKGPDAVPSLIPTILGLAAAALLWVGCFDSDEKVRLAATTGGSTSSGIFDPSTSTGYIEMPTTSTGDATCRDAVDCVFDCAGELQQMVFNDVPEPELGCFLECEAGLSVDEVLTLLRLTECSANVCSDPAIFAPNPPPCDFDGMSTGTSSSGSGGDSGTSGSSDSGGSSSTGAPPPPPLPADPLIDKCLECIIAFVQDETAPECAEFSMACQ